MIQFQFSYQSWRLARRISQAASAFSMTLAMVFMAAPARALVIDANPGADYSSAQALNGWFDLGFSTDIGDETGLNTSLSIPHVTVDASQAGYGLTHWYSFDVAKTSTVILDVDYGAEYVVEDESHPDDITDTFMSLLDWDRNTLAENDDHSPIFGPVAGAGGSIHHYDSFIQALLDPGRYYVAIRQFNSAPFQAQNGYVLQASVTHPVPEPPAAFLLLIALGGLWVRRRNCRQAHQTGTCAPK